MINSDSILKDLKDKLDTIKFPSDTIREKTFALVIAMYISIQKDKKNDFTNYKSFASNYFKIIIKTNDYVKIIKDILIENSILEAEDSYDVKKHISKGYRFNQQIVNQDKPIYIKYNNYNLSSISPLFPTCKSDSYETENKIRIESMYIVNSEELNEYIFPIMDKIRFTTGVIDYLNNINIDDRITLNENITTPGFNIYNGRYDDYYTLDVALSTAKMRSQSLIRFNDIYFIDDLENFKSRKIQQLRLLYAKTVFDIRSQCYYGNRNMTNDRYDYNLTNIKSDLFKYMLLDGRPTVELDIASCQFTILSYLYKDNLDDNFVQMTQNGTLYEHISNKLNICPKEAKQRMLRVAFDKIKKDQDDIRMLFPKTMKFIDKYKKDNGYKAFSNLLQKNETKIMLDGVLAILMKKGYEVLPIHDAIRCKDIDAKQVKREIEDYFEEINFKCFLRAK